MTFSFIFLYLFKSFLLTASLIFFKDINMCRTKRVMRYDWVRTCVCKCECVYNCVWVENNVHVVYLWIWEHIFWPRNTSQMSHCSLMFYTDRLLFFFFSIFLPAKYPQYTYTKQIFVFQRIVGQAMSWEGTLRLYNFMTSQCKVMPQKITEALLCLWTACHITGS